MCNGKPLLSPDERRVAAFLFLYGGGTGPIELEVGEQDTPLRLNFTWSSPAGPESPNVGSFLSSMFSNRYISQTKRVDGTVDRMRYHPDPELTRLIPTNYAEIPGRVMPLWVGHQFPDPRRRTPNDLRGQPAAAADPDGRHSEPTIERREPTAEPSSVATSATSADPAR